MSDLRSVAPPNLPIASDKYERRWYDQFSNVLRLFFNSVSNAVNSLITTKIDGLDGGWRDMLGQAVNPTTGLTIPVWTQIGSGPFYAYHYQVGDQQWFFYHVQHDYKQGTPIYLHVHWLTNGTSTNTVKWQFTYSFARGFNQGASSTYNTTGTVVTVEEAASGVAYRHMTSEIAVPITDPNFEVDGILMVHLKRITNGGTDNANTVYVTMADCHYQSERFNTKNRTPNFYE